MKLTAPTDRVKQAHVIRLFAASTLTGLGLLLLGFLADDEDAHIDQFGTTLAASLASQAIEPILARDLIHLGVLANRTAALPEVLGASIHDMNSEPLALSGDLRRGRIIPNQVTQNGLSLGVVRVHIDETRFGSATPLSLILLSLLWMAVAPALVLSADRLQKVAALVGNRRPHSPSDAEAGPALAAVLPEPEPEPETWELICVNLFNQLSLPPEKCARELDHARDLARRVASLYGGDVGELPRTGIYLSFGPSESADKPFHVLCAAFILSKLLAEGESFGRYRLSLHTLALDPGCVPTPQAEAVRDAAVLSALAGDNGIVMSEAFFRRLPYSQRLISQPLEHPLLDELSTSGGARLALDLEEPHRGLVEERLEELTGQAASDLSTARESTF